MVDYSLHIPPLLPARSSQQSGNPEDLENLYTLTTYALTLDHKCSMPSSTSSSTLIKYQKNKCMCGLYLNTAYLNKALRGRGKLWNAWQSKQHRNARLHVSAHLFPQLHESKRLGSTVNKKPIKEQASLSIRGKEMKNRNPISHLPLVTGNQNPDSLQAAHVANLNEFLQEHSPKTRQQQISHLPFAYQPYTDSLVAN